MSWNFSNNVCSFAPLVTLHVSVWVEICCLNRNTSTLCVTLHVSVWVEIPVVIAVSTPAVSRSTWACELKFNHLLCRGNSNMSRSTWACELKLLLQRNFYGLHCHAPRERVSWNFMPVPNFSISTSRSTWACELKWKFEKIVEDITCHAPRERVSWNQQMCQVVVFFVSSRSTWACELKCEIYTSNIF